jgi:hypothetical protein
MRTITIELPDVITINGAGKAPDSLREVATANWNPEFCLTALIHGISQKIGDTWSVTKGDVEKTKAVHANMVEGDWSRRAAGGISDAKMAEKIAKIDVAKLLSMLSPEQHAAILKAGGDISVITTKQS